MADLTDAISDAIVAKLGKTRRRLANSLATEIAEVLDKGFYRTRAGTVEQFDYTTWDSDKDVL